MRLEDKLASLTNKNVVATLDEMLNYAQVSINWYGQRMVTVGTYEGSVEINDIAKKYLQAQAFDGYASPQERLDCYMLWGRVQKLYDNSEDEIQKTQLYKYLIPLKEFRPYCRACAGDPLAVIEEWEGGGKRDSLFDFTPEKFKELWPGAKPQGKSWRFEGAEYSEEWRASKEMVERVLENDWILTDEEKIV